MLGWGRARKGVRPFDRTAARVPLRRERRRRSSRLVDVAPDIRIRGRPVAAVIPTAFIVMAVVRLPTRIHRAIRDRPRRTHRSGGPGALPWELDPDFHRASPS